MRNLINLRNNWRAIETVAKKRLKNNSNTDWHRSEFGNELEIMGAAGEIAARRFLKLPLGLKTTFDNGVDLIWRGHTVDVKATRWVPTIMGRYLQWPENKKIKADYILMTAVRLEEKEAVILGFCSRQELEHADVNPERDIPCKEIPIRKLKDPAELLTLSPKRKGSKAKKYATGSGKSVTANA